MLAAECDDQYVELARILEKGHPAAQAHGKELKRRALTFPHNEELFGRDRIKLACRIEVECGDLAKVRAA
jgi:hypothetical protein